ncbi:MAG: hypothetical protein JXA43_02770 [Candidatus Diapherotrites archaeon]|nr:hypothetical protein [Candidatus Diapherotrites archaeon]
MEDKSIQLRFKIEERPIEEIEEKELEPQFACKLNIFPERLERSMGSVAELGTIWE